MAWYHAYEASVDAAVAAYPKPAAMAFEYGTAGFRTKYAPGVQGLSTRGNNRAKTLKFAARALWHWLALRAAVLAPAMLRIGLLAAMRSLASGGQAVGVMVTASHNPVEVRCRIPATSGD